ncbi:Putative sulfate transporter YbaR [Durusdinium trenchii]|uniref:Sulfate transporter YbaR n=1 Tax=Durusdinium trenchii TaxID=1381693 RepID=A0ABP0HH97_9DINO
MDEPQPSARRATPPDGLRHAERTCFAAKAAPKTVSADVKKHQGLTAEVTRLRRKTQATVALDLLGAPYAKVLGHHFDFENFMTVTEQLASNSTFVLLLHAGAVWYYQAFLRDHLMARHVTRITLERVEAEITVAYVETGPWLRRVELGRQAPSPSSVSFRRLLTNGCLHVDRRLGTISDEAAFRRLCEEDLFPVKEEMFTDGDAKSAAHLGAHEPSPLVAEDSEGTLSWLENLRPAWLLRPLQWHGQAFCASSTVTDLNSPVLYTRRRYFGNLFLTMGITSVIIWLPGPGSLRLKEL